MSSKHRFHLEWMLLNPLGFTLGSLLGATDNGLIPTLLPGYPGLILGDLVFGAMIGLGQYLVFRRTKFLPISLFWIAATSLGFTLGARVGALLTFRITEHWVLAGIIFGVFMGGSIGLATSLVLFRNISPSPMATWLAACMLAWIAGESIAFASKFALATVPLVALAIAAVTAVGFTRLQPRIRQPDD